MTCLEVREHLPELAVGVLPDRDRRDVERHLQWCAGCRKEAADLGQAAATLAYALAPTPVPSGLAERVVARVRRASGAPGTARRTRVAAALAIAAMTTVAALGWGAVMAGRAERFADRAALAERRRADALTRFDRVLVELLPGRQLAPDETFLGRLTPTEGHAGGGAVLQLVSPTSVDFVIVLVNGLDPEDAEAIPYRVSVANGEGETIRVGLIDEVDPSTGGAEVFREFADRDLSGYTAILVRDARGDVVLEGTVARSHG